MSLLRPFGSATLPRPRRITVDVRSSLVALAYLGMIYWLVSRWDPSAGGDPPVRFSVLYHIPLYAGLGFFILLAISRGQGLTAHRWARAWLTFTATTILAVLAEWHRSHVFGRDPFLGDLLMDQAGVAGMLLVCGFGTDGDMQQ